MLSIVLISVVKPPKEVQLKQQEALDRLIIVNSAVSKLRMLITAIVNASLNMLKRRSKTEHWKSSQELDSACG
ncbi:hypothetical protein B4O99_15845 [Shewanella xiamenensis]|nr:hypothetical protein [Shewanella xiamenensis]